MPTWTPPPLPARLAASAESTLVGRRRELGVLEDVWQAVENGGRRVLFIGGEPGAGKTRLAAEAGSVLHREGAVVLLGTSVAEFGIPYQPFVEAVDELLGGTEAGALSELVPDSAVDLIRLTPLVARHRPDLVHDAPSEGEYRREMFDAFADLLVAVSADRPVVLVLEDLHWAGAPALQLLTHVVQSTARTRLFILATLRTTAPDRSDELTYAAAELYRLDGVQRIDLGGLDVDDIADFLIAESGASRERAQSAAAVLRDQTGGNPFFLRELWREYSHQGGLDGIRRAAFHAPESIRDTLELRISGLNTPEAETVELAALIGDSFELSTLMAAGSVGEDKTLNAVDRAVQIGLIEPESGNDGNYSFVHTIVRQAVVDRIAPSRRAQAHAGIANALEARRSSAPELVARLAHHYTLAVSLGYDAEAVKYLVQAAEIAYRSLAYEEAAAGYLRAAELAPTDREDLLLLAARAHVRAGDFAAGRGVYERLSRAGDGGLRLLAASGYEDASWRPGRFGHRAVELLSDALKDYPSDPSDPAYVRAAASLGRAMAFTGADEEARRLSDKAIAMARDLGDQDLIAHSLQASLWHGFVPETAPVQLERASEVTRIAYTNRNYDQLGPAAYFRAVIAYLQGRRGDWMAAQSDLRRAARTTREPFFDYMVGCIDASQQYLRGDFSGARRTVESLVALGDTFGQDDTEGSYGLQMFMIQRETGGLEHIRPLITGAETLEEHWMPGLLALYTELGLKAAAARTLKDLLDVHLEPKLQSVQWPAIAAFFVDAITMLGDQDAARRLLPVLERYQGCNLVAGQFVAVFGSADRYLAQLKSLLGDDSAEELFESALDMDTRMGSLVHQAETLATYAGYLESGSDRRSRDRAREFRNEAVRIARASGQRRILATLHESVELPAGITPRELDVLRLLAEGLSNREIGKRLHISQNTAANHVRSILTKTGSQNRTSAAIFAAKNNLLE